ncbi:MAG: serine hydrolase [Dehalococcoidia bacterium]
MHSSKPRALIAGMAVALALAAGLLGAGGLFDGLASERASAAGGAGAPPLPPRTPRPTPTPPPAPKPKPVVVPGIAFGASASAPGPKLEVGAPHLAPLREAMAAEIAAFDVEGYYAVAVTDLQTGESVSVNGDRPQLSGCVLNIFVLLSALLDVENAEYSLGSVDDLIAQTLWSSNSWTARQLYIKTGGGNLYAGLRKVQSLMVAMGMTKTVVDHPPGYPAETLGWDPNNWTTADSVNRGLSRIYLGEVLAEPYRTILLDAMTQVEPALQYILGTTPGGLVSHKNGWLWEDGWADNDAGIVRFERGGKEYAYAFTFLAMDTRRWKDDVPLAQALVRMAWDHFQAAYPE